MAPQHNWLAQLSLRNCWTIHWTYINLRGLITWISCNVFVGCCSIFVINLLSNCASSQILLNFSYQSAVSYICRLYSICADNLTSKHCADPARFLPIICCQIASHRSCSISAINLSSVISTSSCFCWQSLFSHLNRFCCISADILTT